MTNLCANRQKSTMSEGNLFEKICLAHQWLLSIALTCQVDCVDICSLRELISLTLSGNKITVTFIPYPQCQRWHLL